VPVPVQGPGAAERIADAIRMLCRIPRVDVAIVGRGGGSLEDLWAFNEEPLVRAVAECRLPIISAVGHEIDFTLCDFAADVRAETPSAAAELITSHFIGCSDRVRQAQDAMMALTDAGLRQARGELDHARSRLRLLSPAAQIEQGALRVDDLANRLSAALRLSTQMHRQRLGELRSLLVQRSPERRLQIESHRLLSLWKRLQGTSPASVLQRGFVIMRDAGGRPVTRRAGVESGQRLDAQFVDGFLPVRAE